MFWQRTTWRTDEGAPYSAIVPLYGRLVASDSHDFKEVCEARSILAMPLGDRAREMAARAARRGGKDDLRVGRIRAALEAAVLTEWKWRQAQKVAA